MAYSTPRTWVAGEYPTAAQFNANIRDNVSFLANPPACRVYNSAVESIPNNAETTLTFDSERFDTDTMHDTVTNNNRITIKTAGLYIVTLNFGFPTNGTGYRYGVIRLNGATNIAASSTNPGAITGNVDFSLSSIYKFAVNDYIEGRAFQTSGGALNVNALGNFSPEFAAVWVGLG